MQVALTNNTGKALSSFDISYDIDRLSVASAANELPGYQLFYSTNGTTWTNDAALNPTLTNVPNTIGVTSLSGVVNLATAVSAAVRSICAGSDDDASQSSPDQINGLNNVAVTPVPLAPALPLFVSAIGGLGFVARRRSR